MDVYVTWGTRYAAEIQWEENELDGCTRPPTFTLDPGACQALMDSLFASGFRPSQATGSAGQREALEKHLDDMRTIAFMFLETKNHDAT
jgi:hypothetical protein